MNLTVKTRAKESKSATKQMRRSGNIPAVFYAPGDAPQLIEVKGAEFEAVLRKLKTGMLSTTVFTLELEGKKKKAIVKDVQYGLTSYCVLHLDFEELKEDVLVTVKVPLEFEGVADCVGVKLGGFIRPVIRYVKVKCLPKDIPQEFKVDVRQLGMRQARRLSDIQMPKGVLPLATTNEVVVVIAKR